MLRTTLPQFVLAGVGGDDDWVVMEMMQRHFWLQTRYYIDALPELAGELRDDEADLLLPRTEPNISSSGTYAKMPKDWPNMIK